MMAEHEIIVVGRDVSGGWTVRESSGVLLGRFISSAAANRFAFDEQRSRLDSSVALSDGVPTLRISGHRQSPSCFWRRAVHVRLTASSISMRPRPRRYAYMNKRPKLGRPKEPASVCLWVVAAFNARLTSLQRRSHDREHRNDQSNDTRVKGQRKPERSRPRTIRVANPEQETADGKEHRKRNDQRHRRLN